MCLCNPSDLSFLAASEYPGDCALILVSWTRIPSGPSALLPPSVLRMH
jgi:hypothetical protein